MCLCCVRVYAYIHTDTRVSRSTELESSLLFRSPLHTQHAETTAARRCFTAALEADPLLPDAWVGLALTFEGAPLLQQVCSERPNSVCVSNTPFVITTHTGGLEHT